jgi:hypothetical protein
LSAGSAVNAGSTNITATTKWVLQPGRPTVASTGPNGAPVAAGTRGGDKP